MEPGYVMATAECFGCGRLVSFNPRLVPSYENRPICAVCVKRVNPMREENGLPPIVIPDGAYEPLPENEL